MGYLHSLPDGADHALAPTTHPEVAWGKYHELIFVTSTLYLVMNSALNPIKRRVKVAKGRGFDGSMPSIHALVRSLGDGRTTLEAAKKKMVCVEKGYFKVLNTSDQFIFYVAEGQGGEPSVCVAVATQDGEFYGDNAPLRAEAFFVSGARQIYGRLGNGRGSRYV